MTVSTIPTELLIFSQPRFNWIVHHHRLASLVYKLDCCFQGQGHSDSTKLHWIFMYLTSSVPLISWQPNLVCCFTVTNTQTKYNKVGIYCQQHFDLLGMQQRGRGLFCRARWQTLFSVTLETVLSLSWRPLPEVTLCDWQDVKIQLLTNSWISCYIFFELTLASVNKNKSLSPPQHRGENCWSSECCVDPKADPWLGNNNNGGLLYSANLSIKKTYCAVLWIAQTMVPQTMVAQTVQISKVLSAENPELSKVLWFKPGVGQNIALHALTSVRNSVFLAHSTSFPPILKLKWRMT